MAKKHRKKESHYKMIWTPPSYQLVDINSLPRNKRKRYIIARRKHDKYSAQARRLRARCDKKVKLVWNKATREYEKMIKLRLGH